MREWIQSRFGPGGPGLLLLTLALSVTSPTQAAPFTQGPPGPLLLSQSGILFPPIQVGKSFAYPRASELANISTAAVTITSVAITGANAGDFAVAGGCQGISLNPKVLCPLVVTFKPTDVGARNAVLVITPSSGAALSVPLFGTGLAAPAGAGGGGGGGGTGGAATSGALTVSAPDFGSVNVGSSSVKTVTLSNAGPGLLGILKVSGIGGTNAGDFKKLSDTGNIGFAPGGLRLITIQFTPSAPGLRTATLTVTSTSAGSPTVVTLTGTGVAVMGH